MAKLSAKFMQPHEVGGLLGGTGYYDIKLYPYVYKEVEPWLIQCNVELYTRVLFDVVSLAFLVILVIGGLRCWDCTLTMAVAICKAFASG